jgi:hypothetical protein
MTAKEKGGCVRMRPMPNALTKETTPFTGGAAIHQSCDGGEDQDDQHRYIIGPRGFHTSQRAILAPNKVYKMYMN